MRVRRCIIAMIAFFLAILTMEGKNGYVVVVDSETGFPLPNASVYDRHGKPVGMSDRAGRLESLPQKSFPITIRYLGFQDMKLKTLDADTVFMQEESAVLPEVVIESTRRKLLHILAYIREYSTLTTYTDTVFLFREKMVDYMLPTDDKVKFRGWSNPRTLTAKSYVRFTDVNGLDSVSDATSNHFSWSDWVGLPPAMPLPDKLNNAENGRETIFGRYSQTETWEKAGDKVAVKVDVLADATSRRWVPQLAGFARNKVDFETLKLSCFYEDVVSDKITPVDIEKIAYRIESQGRGRDMFRFNKKDEPFFVSTDAEVYVIDHEYLTEKMARKWEAKKTEADLTEILLPPTAPELPSDIQYLVSRVEGIDKYGIRLGIKPDQKLIRTVKNPKYGPVGRTFHFLKKRLGI